VSTCLGVAARSDWLVRWSCLGPMCRIVSWPELGKKWPFLATFNLHDRESASPDSQLAKNGHIWPIPDQSTNSSGWAPIEFFQHDLCCIYWRAPLNQETTVTVDVRAIDVGYFSTKLTLGRKLAGDTSMIATTLFPSLAPRLPATMSLQTALHGRPDGSVVNVDDVNYFVGRDACLYSSGREPREVLPDYCMTDKYQALMRGALQYIAQDAKAKSELVIRHLVLGLPLNTFGDNRDKLAARATGEHLLPDPASPGSMRRVTVQKASVIVQPQGALVSYGAMHTQVFKDGWVLVVDPGGGTLDWYVARGRLPNWQRSGAYPKSMLACAYAVADRIDPTWRDNFEIIERIDRAIRENASSFTTAGNVYDLGPFAGVIEAVLKESTDKMVARLGSMDNLDLILFTGGGAKVYYEFFRSRYPKLANILCMDEDPVFSNVKGFHVAGEIMSASK
jgi:plasmid segregation protein ParM